MAGDASVPFSSAEVWEEEPSRDQGRLRSRSREHQTYNAGGVARDVAEDDDEGFLAAQRRTFEEGVCARRLEESEEQIPPETSHAEANICTVTFFKEKVTVQMKTMMSVQQWQRMYVRTECLAAVRCYLDWKNVC